MEVRIVQPTGEFFKLHCRCAKKNENISALI
jgi:hypothetical protein